MDGKCGWRLAISSWGWDDCQLSAVWKSKSRDQEIPPTEEAGET